MNFDEVFKEFLGSLVKEGDTFLPSDNRIKHSKEFFDFLMSKQESKVKQLKQYFNDSYALIYNEKLDKNFRCHSVESIERGIVEVFKQ